MNVKILLVKMDVSNDYVHGRKLHSYSSILINFLMIFPAEEPKVFLPFLLPPTIIQGPEDCDPSYTMSVDNELTIEERRIFMEWQERK